MINLFLATLGCVILVVMCDYGNTPSKIQYYLKQYENEWIHYFWHEFVLKNEDTIHWEWLSKTPNITWEIVKDNPDKPWDWSYLSQNQFKINKEIFIERKLKEHMMVFRIQCRWRRANYDPKYKLCKKRLMKECKMLGFE